MHHSFTCQSQLVVLVVVGGWLLAGCGQPKPPSSRPASTDNADNDSSASTLDPQELVTITSSEFQQRLSNDDVKDLAGKTLRLEGYLTHFDHSEFGSWIWISDKPQFLSGAKWLTSEPQIWKRALPYQRITLTSSLEELTNGYVTVAQVTGERIVITAEQLTRRIVDPTSADGAPDERTSKADLKNRFIELSGKLKTIADDGNSIELAGYEGSLVACYITKIGDWKTGDTVRLVGECSGDAYGSPPRVEMSQCWPLLDATAERTNEQK